MTTEIHMSAMEATGFLQEMLTEFEASHRIHVHLRSLSWDTGWTSIADTALGFESLDVSEVGTTWVASLASMDAVCPFAGYELASLGGAQAFLPAVWQSCVVPDASGRGVAWAVPWLSDTKLIYYRRDLLKQAGIDEPSAFRNHESLVQTLQRLCESGVDSLLVLPVADPLVNLHLLASWVMGRGGHFVSQDGKRLLFNEPEARSGICAYYSLHRFLAPAVRDPGLRRGAATLQAGESAVAMLALKPNILLANPPVARDVGVASIPGAPFVGGSNLVVWRNARHRSEAVKLVRFLTSPQIQKKYLQQVSDFAPVRLDVLNKPPFATDPKYRVVVESLMQGRGFCAPYTWGLIEDKLSVTLSQLWTDILSEPDLALEEQVAERLGELAGRLDGVLQGICDGLWI